MGAVLNGCAPDGLNRHDGARRPSDRVAGRDHSVHGSISLAATVRVGHAVGRRDPVATRRAGFGAIALGAALMVAMTVTVVAFHDAIPRLFLGYDSGGNAATAQLAATLLLIGASFFVTDGVQAIAADALRGLNDTRVPMLFAAVSFWLIGFTCAYGLAFPGRLGAVGIWI